MSLSNGAFIESFHSRSLELESDWDWSTESLRQTMMAFAERQRDDIRKEWIDILKLRFGEDYDREYILKPLAEEHQKTQELPRAQDTSKEGQIPMEIPKPSLGNFVEQVAGQKHEVSMVESATENPRLDLCDDELEPKATRNLDPSLVFEKGVGASPQEAPMFETSTTRPHLRTRRLATRRSFKAIRKRKQWERDRGYFINDDFAQQYGKREMSFRFGFCDYRSRAAKINNRRCHISGSQLTRPPVFPLSLPLPVPTGQKLRSKEDDLKDDEARLSKKSSKEKQQSRPGEELLDLIHCPTSKEAVSAAKFKSKGGAHVKYYCKYLTKEDCRLQSGSHIAYNKRQFRRLIASHTDVSLGDCSLLDTFHYMKTCKYGHYELDMADAMMAGLDKALNPLRADYCSDSFRILGVSDNCIEFLGLLSLASSSHCTEYNNVKGLIGVNARMPFTSSSGASWSTVASFTEISFLNPVLAQSRTTQKPFYAILHRIDAGSVIELEPAKSGDIALTLAGAVQFQKLAVRAISRLQSLPGEDSGAWCDTVVEDVQRLTAYDRVMVYQFHEDDHGEVVSEIRSSELEPYLGLHCPATDIPQAARFLFKQNPLRMICDCNATPVKVVPTSCSLNSLMDAGYPGAISLGDAVCGKTERFLPPKPPDSSCFEPLEQEVLQAVCHMHNTYISDGSPFNPKLIKQFDASAIGEHEGAFKTFKKLSQEFFWKDMKKNVEDTIGEWVIEPRKLLDIRKNESGRGAEVLVQWTGLPTLEVTWELLATLMNQFLDFNLEDKVNLLWGSIDRLRIHMEMMNRRLRTKGRRARAQVRKSGKGNKEESG